MNKICLLTLFLYLVACSSLEDTLTLKKKTSGDEFLVEKKNPLVVPPDFEKLPKPLDQNSDLEKNNQEEEDNEIQKILVNKNNTSIKSNQSQNSSLENLILEKIK